MYYTGTTASPSRSHSLSNDPAPPWPRAPHPVLTPGTAQHPPSGPQGPQSPGYLVQYTNGHHTQHPHPHQHPIQHPPQHQHQLQHHQHPHQLPHAHHQHQNSLPGYHSPGSVHAQSTGRSTTPNAANGPPILAPAHWQQQLHRAEPRRHIIVPAPQPSPPGHLPNPQFQSPPLVLPRPPNRPPVLMAPTTGMEASRLMRAKIVPRRPTDTHQPTPHPWSTSCLDLPRNVNRRAHGRRWIWVG
ncbi:hypothetical protein FRC12_020744 [Ceratobasidium sp. 428]|nr:hypothetical protein FRC12_020744 [Ceratobasidium sp. 428]